MIDPPACPSCADISTHLNATMSPARRIGGAEPAPTVPAFPAGIVRSDRAFNPTFDEPPAIAVESRRRAAELRRALGGTLAVLETSVATATAALEFCETNAEAPPEFTREGVELKTVKDFITRATTLIDTFKPAPKAPAESKS